jgi:hypothetical protein
VKNSVLDEGRMLSLTIRVLVSLLVVVATTQVLPEATGGVSVSVRR